MAPVPVRYVIVVLALACILTALVGSAGRAISAPSQAAQRSPLRAAAYLATIMVFNSPLSPIWHPVYLPVIARH